MLQAQQPYAWRLTDEMGLPSNEVYDVMQDSKGYIWIGTDRGLARYDGNEIKTYKHPDSKGLGVTYLQEDDLGRIWHMNFRNQLFYIENDSIHRFEALDTIEISRLHLYATYKNDIYIYEKNKLLKFDHDQQIWTIKERYSFPQEFSSAYARKSRNFEGFYIYQNNHNIYWVDFDRNMEIKFNSTTSVFSIESIADSVLLVASQDEVELISSKRNKVSNKAINNNAFNKNSGNIVDVAVVDENQFWVLTHHGAYGYQYYAENDSVSFFYTLLEGDKVSSIEKDREGNYWVGTLDKGIFIYPNLDITLYNQENSNLSNQRVNCLEKAQNNTLFLGQGDGAVHWFNPKDNEEIDVIPSVHAGNTSAVYYDTIRQDLYFNANGLNKYTYNPIVKKFDQPKLLARGANHNLIHFGDDYFLIGTYTVCQLMDTKPVDLNTAFQENGFFDVCDDECFFDWKHLGRQDLIRRRILRNNRVNALLKDKDNDRSFYVGYGDDLYYYHGDTFDIIKGKDGEAIWAMDIEYDKDGNLWVGTQNNGLLKLVNHKVVAHYSVEDGIPSTYCRVVDLAGDLLWGGTEKGVYQLNIKTEEIHAINNLDGLPINDILDIKILGDKVYCATLKGLISLDKNIQLESIPSPLVHLNKVLVNRQTRDLAADLVLSYDENNLEFFFDGITFRSRGAQDFHYRLLGAGEDTTWNIIGGENTSARFQSLGAGDYIFQIKLQDYQGNESEIKEYRFRISLPYWRTWWFLITTYGLVGLIIYRIIMLRNANQKRKEALESSMSRLKMQALQSQMNPHFVFNALSAIQSYWLQKKTKKALLYHNKFAKLIRSIFEYSNKYVIPVHEEILFLQNYTALEQLRFEDIEVVWDIDQDYEDLNLFVPPLLIQPIIENSFKHGFLPQNNQGELYLSIEKRENYLYVIVQDNGIGRSASNEEKTNLDLLDIGTDQRNKRRSSTDVIIERLSILQEEYNIEDRHQSLMTIIDLIGDDGEAKGTKVCIKIPFVNNPE